ncbi:MAG: cation-translocating P-type ATPase [Lachnospiraceae bacterium]|nr:cation-translocating P-type ATPase [Lachnospiraceae bacterium]
MKRITDKMEWLLELGGTKRDIVFLVISGVALLASMFHLLPLPFDAAWVAIILCGVPIMMEAFIGLVTEFDIKADVLVSIALLASVVIGEDFAAGEVAFIMQIGGLLEELTVAKARAGIEKLVHLTPQTARVISDAGEEIIAAELVVKDALLRVLPGETIPVDGVIVKGETSVNQAVLTGESLPVDKGVGDEVSSGTVNQFGAFEMRATRVGEDSSIQRMIRLVQSADAGKAKIVGIADRWATWIVVAALSAAALTWLVTGEIIRAVTILVVFCPCALVLATPTAIMAGIGNATRHGFLVREGDALERLAKVNRIAFDKTGTLTFGQPCVTAIKSYSEACPEKELYAYAAAAEQYSEHPLGKAIVTCYKKEEGNVLQQAEGFCLLAGQGVTATVAGKVLCIGNERLLQANEATIPEKAREDADRYIREGSTVIYVAEEKQFLGFLVLSDTMRGDSAGMIQKLQAQGVVPMLLTGDHDAAAMHIARQAGISAVHADCLPEDKLNWISTYQKRGESIAMIGDGINDAPALKMADVGIAMGGVGSDIAVDAADIALVDDEIKELPHLMALSKKMMRTIHLNLTFSLTLNFIAVALAITGILNPVVGALVHNAGSVLVILNSFFVLNYKSHLN